MKKLVYLFLAMTLAWGALACKGDEPASNGEQPENSGSGSGSDDPDVVPSDSPANRDRIWGLFGTSDTLAHYEPLFLEHYTHAFHFPGAHTPTPDEVLRYYVPLVVQLIDRYAQAENPATASSVDPPPPLAKTIRFHLPHHNSFCIFVVLGYGLAKTQTSLIPCSRRSLSLQPFTKRIPPI